MNTNLIHLEIMGKESDVESEFIFDNISLTNESLHHTTIEHMSPVIPGAIVAILLTMLSLTALL